MSFGRSLRCRDFRPGRLGRDLSADLTASLMEIPFFYMLPDDDEFIAADASADTAFADGILQKLSDKADGEVPFFMPVSVVDDL